MGNSNGEFEAKKYFTDHWKANTIHLFVAVKGKCFWSILFPFPELPRDYTINVATTRLFA